MLYVAVTALSPLASSNSKRTVVNKFKQLNIMHTNLEVMTGQYRFSSNHERLYAALQVSSCSDR